MTKPKVTYILRIVFLSWLVVSIALALTISHTFSCNQACSVARNLQGLVATLNRIKKGCDRPWPLRLTSTVLTVRCTVLVSTLEFQRLAAAAVWHARCISHSRTENTMLKISVVDTRTQRQLVLEGRLIAPWVAELRAAWKRAKTELDGRELVIDIGNVLVISQEAENTLLQMMNEGARFRCCSGVLTKHVVQQLMRRSKKSPIQPATGDER